MLLIVVAETLRVGVGCSRQLERASLAEIWSFSSNAFDNLMATPSLIAVDGSDATR